LFGVQAEFAQGRLAQLLQNSQEFVEGVLKGELGVFYGSLFLGIFFQQWWILIGFYIFYNKLFELKLVNKFFLIIIIFTSLKR
jgi:hypothetical protein